MLVAPSFICIVSDGGWVPLTFYHPLLSHFYILSDYIGPTQIIQDNLPTLGSADYQSSLSLVIEHIHRFQDGAIFGAVVLFSQSQDIWDLSQN